MFIKHMNIVICLTCFARHKQASIRWTILLLLETVYFSNYQSLKNAISANSAEQDFILKPHSLLYRLGG